jgi:hypothetical protein
MTLKYVPHIVVIQRKLLATSICNQRCQWQHCTKCSWSWMHLWWTSELLLWKQICSELSFPRQFSRDMLCFTWIFTLLVKFEFFHFEFENWFGSCFLLKKNLSENRDWCDFLLKIFWQLLGTDGVTEIGEIQKKYRGYLAELMTSADAYLLHGEYIYIAILYHLKSLSFHGPGSQHFGKTCVNGQSGTTITCLHAFFQNSDCLGEMTHLTM